MCSSVGGKKTGSDNIGIETWNPNLRSKSAPLLTTRKSTQPTRLQEVVIRTMSTASVPNASTRTSNYHLPNEQLFDDGITPRDLFNLIEEAATCPKPMNQQSLLKIIRIALKLGSDLTWNDEDSPTVLYVTISDDRLNFLE